MTIKQFAQKYEMDYQIPYKALWEAGAMYRVRGKNMDFDEAVIKASVVKFVNSKIAKHKEQIDMYAKHLERIYATEELEGPQELR